MKGQVEKKGGENKMEKVIKSERKVMLSGKARGT